MYHGVQFLSDVAKTGVKDIYVRINAREESDLNTKLLDFKTLIAEKMNDGNAGGANLHLALQLASFPYPINLKSRNTYLTVNRELLTALDSLNLTYWLTSEYA